MFVYSIRGQKLKLHASIALSVLAVLLVILFVPPAKGAAEFDPQAAQVGAEAVHRPKKIKSNEDRIAFLRSYGYETENVPYEAREVLIPVTFDPIYEKYNRMQKKEGFDLSDYRGKNVTQYRYAVTNYDHNGTVYATLLIYRDRVIGGDLSSTTGEGFMHGFTKGNLFPD